MTEIANQFCAPNSSKSYVKWTTLDALWWKITSKTGAGNSYLYAYKDSWISYNKARIKNSAKANKIPVELLAGVAWIEAGGMPDFVDSAAHVIRSFDWSGPDFMDKNMTITKNPVKTSVGSVSIQLANVFSILKLDLEKIDYKQQRDLIKCLETDAFNLNIVANHLFKLIKHDFKKINTEKLTDEQIIVAASRYNRGTQRKLSDFIASINALKGSKLRKYSEYGRSLMRRKNRIHKLLQNH